MGKIGLTFTDSQTGKSHDVVGTLTDAELALLERFIAYCEELNQTQWVRDGMHSSMSVNWKEGLPIQVESSFPSPDCLAAFLHRFRPLCLHDEPTSFYNVCNLLARVFKSPLMHNALTPIRELYNGTRMRSRMRVSSKGVVLTSEETLSKWLNAFEYHRDLEKQEALQSLHTAVPFDVSKGLFLSLLTDRANAVFNLSLIVGLILGHRQQLDVQLPGHRQEAGGA